jgi:DNA-binding CsgD family transcriptional regulator
MGKDNGLIDEEGRQAFMLAASDALDTARLEDDGRGKNDPVKWMQWRGLNAVRQLLRDINCRRAGAPSPRQVFEKSLVYQSDLESGGTTYGTSEPISYDQALAQQGHYRAESTEDEAIVDILLDELMGDLTAQERSVAELLINGRHSTGEIELKCVCPPGSGHHCVTNDIAHATGINEQTVRRIVKRIQAKTARVFEVA